MIPQLPNFFKLLGNLIEKRAVEPRLRFFTPEQQSIISNAKAWETALNMLTRFQYKHKPEAITSIISNNILRRGGEGFFHDYMLTDPHLRKLRPHLEAIAARLYEQELLKGRAMAALKALTPAKSTVDPEIYRIATEYLERYGYY
jgi:hypothetical protein